MDDLSYHEVKNIIQSLAAATVNMRQAPSREFGLALECFGQGVVGRRHWQDAITQADSKWQSQATTSRYRRENGLLDREACFRNAMAMLDDTLTVLSGPYGRADIWQQRRDALVAIKKTIEKEAADKFSYIISPRRRSPPLQAPSQSRRRSPPLQLLPQQYQGLAPRPYDGGPFQQHPMGPWSGGGGFY